jgi:hypothetical protein
MKLLRSILAVVAGNVVWMIAFWVPVILLIFAWPALRDAGRIFNETGRYDVFATAMLVAFQLIWPLANGAAGFVTRLISQRQIEVWCLAALLLAYFAYNHFGPLWNVLPDWYNLLVVPLVVPAVLLGSWIAARRFRLP